MDKRIIPNDILLGEVAAVLNEGREAIITPTGNSMLPFIRGGKDRVTLRRTDGVAVGDIVLVRTGGRYILHRIIAVEGNGDRIQPFAENDLNRVVIISVE